MPDGTTAAAYPRHLKGPVVADSATLRWSGFSRAGIDSRAGRPIPRSRDSRGAGRLPAEWQGEFRERDLGENSIVHVFGWLERQTCFQRSLLVLLNRKRRPLLGPSPVA